MIFTPTAQGAKSGTLSIAHNAAGSPTTVSLSGTGMPIEQSRILIASPNIAFGNVSIGSFSDHSFLVSNAGTSTLTVASIASNDPAFTASPTSFTVSPNGAQPVVVRFQPNAPGQRAATLTIAHDDTTTGSPSTVSLTGSGVAPRISLSPAESINFGQVDVGNTEERNLSIFNNGDDVLRVSSINTQTPFSVTPQNFDLSPGNTPQQITVSFNPTATGAITETLTLSSNDPDQPSTQIELRGEGITPAPVDSPRVLSRNLAFGIIPIDSSRTRTVRLVNPTTQTLSARAEVIGAGYKLPTTPFLFDATASDTVDIDITFTAIASIDFPAVLRIEIDGRILEVILSATGQQPPTLEVIPTPLDFVQVEIGRKGEERLQVKNIGGGVVSIFNIRTSRLEFRVAQRDSLPIRLAAGESRFLDVIFTPRKQEFIRGDLVIISDAVNSDETVRLQGEGVEPVTPLPSNLSTNLQEIVFQQLAPGQRDTSTIILTNEGTGILFVTEIKSIDPQVTASVDSLVLDPGQMQQVDIIVEAVESGSPSDTLRIQSNDPDQPIFLIPWRYRQVDPPVLDLLTDHMGFRPLFGRQQVTERIALRNTGNRPLRVELFSQDSQITFRPDSLSVAPNNLVNIQVRFRGQTGGNRSGIIQVLTNDPNASRVEIPWSAPSTLEISSVSPQDGTTSVPIEPEIAITFSEPLLHIGEFIAIDAELIPPPESGDLVDNIQISGNGRTVTFPVTLTGETIYRLIVKSATADSKAELDRAAVFTFTTGAAPVILSTISGTTSLDDGRTLEGTIFVFNPSGDLVAQGSINSDGTYIISDLPEGNYELFAEVFDPNTGFISGGYDANGDNRPDTLILTGQDATGTDISLSATLAPQPSDPVNLGADITLTLSRIGSQTPADTLFDVQAGEEILVWAHAQNVTDLAGFLIEIGYDPAQVAFKRMDENGPGEQNILFGAGGKALFITNPPVDNKVESTGALMGQNFDFFVDGNGLLSVFHFRALETLTEATFQVTRATLQSGSLEEPLSIIDQSVATSAPKQKITEVLGPIKADLDIQEGNQNEKRKESIKPGDTITLQLFAENFPTVTGYGLFIHYDPLLLVFTQNRLNTDFIPGAFERVVDNNGKINVALASFGGTQTSQGNGLLGEFEFTVQEISSDSTTLILDTITLTSSDGIVELPQLSIISLIGSSSCGSDFNCDGHVSFQDFLLFAIAFGGTDPQFDLDGNGTVGFGDFIVFASDFGQSAN